MQMKSLDKRKIST